jgi:hypothetical protein
MDSPESGRHRRASDIQFQEFHQMIQVGGIGCQHINDPCYKISEVSPNRPLKFVSAPRDDNCLSRAEASGFAEVD